MCWYCEQIDRKIEDYRGLSARITDAQSLKSLDILIAALQAEKSRLHVQELNEPANTAPPR